jgi:hypothetical protein
MGFQEVTGLMQSREEAAKTLSGTRMKFLIYSLYDVTLPAAARFLATIRSGTADALEHNRNRSHEQRGS